MGPKIYDNETHIGGDIIGQWVFGCMHFLYMDGEEVLGRI